MATDKATSTIPVETFRTSHDDFDEWILLFEQAVVLGTEVTDADRKVELWKSWLPYKLDDEARVILRSITTNVYAEVKADLRKLLIDPQEAYSWQTNRSTIQWDGKESFHSLAVRVQRAVDKYDPDASKPKEYFFRFRQALPKKYRNAIDLGCAEDKRTIDEAKKIAMRVQMTEADGDDKEVVFTGASMADDRLKTLEMDFQKMGVRMDGLEGGIQRVESSLKEMCAKSRGHESSLERYNRRYPDRNRGSRDGRDYFCDRWGSQDRYMHSPWK
jgi:hypothetical protein